MTTRYAPIAALIVLVSARAGLAQPADRPDAATAAVPAAIAAETPDRSAVGRPAAGKSTPTAEPATKESVPGDGDPSEREAGPAATAGAIDDTAVPAAQPSKEPDDAVLDRAQPDFTVVNLPTTLRLPKFKSAFRVTHRFTRPLGEGDFSDLLSDFFGFDSGALIGLEYRFGIWTGAQVGILRTSNRTIQFFGDYSIKTQSESFPLGLSAHVSVDGTDNFSDSYTPAMGIVVSRTFGTRAAAYVEPFWVNNTNPLPSELVDDNSTMVIGFGGRVRIGGTTYLVGEIVPRVGGFDPGVDLASFGIEKRAGGHSFQLNFSNSFGTTLGQVARGGLTNDNWYIGFNISRKFY